jgi:uncharacterized phage-associated protein
MSLEKLMYYAQCFHLALQDAPLFHEEILAWQNGPAVRTIFKRFAAYGGTPIIPDTEQRIELPTSEVHFLEEVVSFLGRYTAIRLSDATHLEAPWVDARDGVPAGATPGNPITQNAMKSYYLALMSDGELALSRHALLDVISEPRWASLYVAGICARRMTAHPFYDASLAHHLSAPVPETPTLEESFYAPVNRKDFIEFEKGADIDEQIRRAR